MKVCHRYEDLTKMFHYNPISCKADLFENMETQHFYEEEDIKNKKPGMFKYVYWCDVDYEEFENREENEEFKSVILNFGYSYDENCDPLPPVPLDDGYCEIPEGVTKIGHHCCQGCRISYVSLPSTLKEIDDYALCGTDLTSVDIPSGCKYIGYESFPEDCNKYWV